MKWTRQWNLRGRIATMAIFTFALLLAGCGQETAESEAPLVESTVVSTEQTVSADIEESETADKGEETPGRFQYDYTRLYGGIQGLPVIEEKQAMAEGKTLLTLQTSLPNSWLKYSIEGFNRQSTDYFIRLEETYGEGVKERLSVELMAGRSLRNTFLSRSDWVFDTGIGGGPVPGLREFWNFCCPVRKTCGG